MSESKRLPDKEYDNNNKPIITQILDNYGYGIRTVNNIVLRMFSTTIGGIMWYYFPLLLIPLKNYYSMSHYELDIIASIFFAGMAIGSLFIPYLVNHLGRVWTINLALMICTICLFCTSFSHDKISFSVLRVIIGISGGVLPPISQSRLLELMPLKHRGFWQTMCWGFSIIGALLMLYLMYIIMPDLEESQLPKLLKITCVFPLLCLIYNFFCLEDGPINLILQNKEDKAFLILDSYCRKPLSTDQKKRILKEVKCLSDNKQYQGTIAELFSSEFFRTTILMLCVNSIISSILNGMPLVLSLTIEHLGIEGNQKRNREDVIKGQIIIFALSLFGPIIGGILTELPILGRVRSTSLIFIFGLLSTILSLLFMQFFEFFNGLAFLASQTTLFIVNLYISEIFPTKLREQALSFFQIFSRAIIIIVQFLYLELNYVHYLAPYYLNLILFGVGAALIELLPYETYGQNIDMVIKKQLETLEDEKEKLNSY
jgi:MFS family permease